MSSKKSSANNLVVKLESKNLHDYLKSQLSCDLLAKLYEYPEICLAVSYYQLISISITIIQISIRFFVIAFKTLPSNLC